MSLSSDHVPFSSIIILTGSNDQAMELLHTRTTILLPPASKPLPETSALTEARRVERAEKVALAQDPDPSSKEKADNREGEGSSQKGVLESDAIDRYLEDAEWEEQERKDGREPVIQKFPWGPPGQKLEQSPGAQQRPNGFKWPWSL